MGKDKPRNGNLAEFPTAPAVVERAPKGSVNAVKSDGRTGRSTKRKPPEATLAKLGPDRLEAIPERRGDGSIRLKKKNQKESKPQSRIERITMERETPNKKGGEKGACGLSYWRRGWGDIYERGLIPNTRSDQAHSPQRKGREGG